MKEVKYKAAKSHVGLGQMLNRPMFKIFEEFYQKLFESKALQKQYNVKPLIYMDDSGSIRTTVLGLDNIGLSFVVLEYKIDKEVLKLTLTFEVYRDSEGVYSFHLNVRSEQSTMLDNYYIFDNLGTMALETSNLKGKMLSMRDNALDWEIVKPPKRDFGDIYLPNRITNDLRLFRKIYKEQDKILRYLFVGAPGSGKTESSIVLANELLAEGVTIVKTKIDDFFNEKVELAQILAPSVILLDDVDLALGSRSSGGVSRYLQSFLDILDGTQKLSPKVGILATTNSLELLDIAARRAGRFDKTVLFDEINKENIKGIIGKTLFINHGIENVDPAFLDDQVVSLFYDNNLTGSHVYNMLDLLYRKMLIEKESANVEWIVESLNDDIKMLNLVRDYKADISDRYPKKAGGGGAIGFASDDELEDDIPAKYEDRSVRKTVKESPRPLGNSTTRRR